MAPTPPSYYGPGSSQGAPSIAPSSYTQSPPPKKYAQMNQPNSPPPSYSLPYNSQSKTSHPQAQVPLQVYSSHNQPQSQPQHQYRPPPHSHSDGKYPRPGGGGGGPGYPSSNGGRDDIAFYESSQGGTHTTTTGTTNTYDTSTVNGSRFDTSDGRGRRRRGDKGRGKDVAVGCCAGCATACCCCASCGVM